jgi:hypothetical protein
MYYPILAVYTGAQLSTLSSVASTFGNSQLILSAVGGRVYQIEIDDYWGYGGNYTFTLSPY